MNDHARLPRFTILTLIVGIIVSLAIVANYNRLHKAEKPLPELVEEPKIVVVRVYANVIDSDDSYLLVSADGFVCYITQDAWLQTVVGQKAECLWRKI